MLVQQTIIKKLTDAFQPIVLQVENESHKHRTELGAETHFKVTLVSAQFETMRTIARHRAVYQCLENEIATGVHALALHTYTQSEWLAQGEVAPKSPSCTGSLS